MGKQKAVGNVNSSSTDCSATSPDLLCEEDVQCPICLNLLVEPVRMPCSHCLCRTCFTTNLKKSTLQCPVCRARIGTFARRSMKADTLVDKVLWKTIQRQFKQRLELQKMETADRGALIPINREVLSPVIGSSAAPGEIRKEFEQQMRQLQQAHQLAEQENQNQNQMADDEQLATRLQAELNTPAGLTRRQSLASAGMSVSVSSIGSESDDDEEDASESNKRSARRLFMNMSKKTAAAKDSTGGSLSSTSRKRKAAPSRGGAAKENSAPRQRVRSGSKKRQHFAGCVKRPRLAGTTALNITLDTTDDETEVSFKSSNTSLNTSNDKVLTPKSLTSNKVILSKANVIVKANKKTNNVARQTNAKSFTAAEGNNKPAQTSDAKCTAPKRTRTSPIAKATNRAFGANNTSDGSSIASGSSSGASSNRGSLSSGAGSNRGSLSSGAGSSRGSLSSGAGSNRGSLSSGSGSSKGSLSSGAGSSRTSSGYGSTTSSSVSPQQRGRKQLRLDELQDVALALLKEGPLDLTCTAALVAEQRVLEKALKQEAEDMKLARRLQRQFSKLQVDRTQGSGEEYGLRSRDEPVGKARWRTSAGKRSLTRAVREPSPCY